MNKITLVFLVSLFFIPLVAQETTKHDIKVGLIFQRTHYMYLENGIGVDYSNVSIFQKQLHFKAAYISSRFGSAIESNAIKQDNFLLGADWRFRSGKSLEIPVGLNTGLFIADYENQAFDVLPNTAILFSMETGLVYNFDFPVTAGLTVGYNFKHGNGVDVPGTLFPLFYRLSVYYRL